LRHRIKEARRVSLQSPRQKEWPLPLTRSGDKLFEQWPGDDSPLELLPLSENWYFVRDDAGTIEFVRDKSGTVIAHRYRNVAGDIIATRMR
jgi:hypothetical protein